MLAPSGPTSKCVIPAQGRDDIRILVNGQGNLGGGGLFPITNAAAPRLAVEEIRLYERPVTLRMPFRFGIVTMTAAPQAFARVRISLPDGRGAWGATAEMMVPKWFDKDPALTNDQNFDQLRTALDIARGFYLDAGVATAFGLTAACYPAQIAAGAERGLNSLTAAYGPALIDRAVMDALCRVLDVPFAGALRANLPGIAPGALAPDLAEFEIEKFLATMASPNSIEARHTVGLTDPLTAAAADVGDGDRIGDGLPQTLEDVAAAYRHRYFKIKVAGDIAGDLDRLGRIAAVLDGAGRDYQASLDGNEQYDDAAGIAELWRRMNETPGLARFVERIIYIEQPIARRTALAAPLGAMAGERPMVIDESDESYDIFPRARELGYRGVSSKSCKGFYKSTVNAARCALWNRDGGGYFMTGEDLTCQAGLSVQQDLVLAASLGLTHVERNGHHYARGMSAAAEQEAFARAHPDLYDPRDGTAMLRIRDGAINIASLDVAGFASAAEPLWSSMAEMRAPPRDG